MDTWYLQSERSSSHSHLMKFTFHQSTNRSQHEHDSFRLLHQLAYAPSATACHEAACDMLHGIMVDRVLSGQVNQSRPFLSKHGPGYASARANGLFPLPSSGHVLREPHAAFIKFLAACMESRVCSTTDLCQMAACKVFEPGLSNRQIFREAVLRSAMLHASDYPSNWWVDLPVCLLQYGQCHKAASSRAALWAEAEGIGCAEKLASQAFCRANRLRVGSCPSSDHGMQQAPFHK